MGEEEIEILPILPKNWNNLRYFFRSVHLAQALVNGRLVDQGVKGLTKMHEKVLRLGTWLYGGIKTINI